MVGWRDGVSTDPPLLCESIVVGSQLLFVCLFLDLMSVPPPTSDKVRLIGVGGVRQVSEASFDFLHMEMVQYFTQQIATQDTSSPEVQNKKLATKLELMGYEVGQRLAERYTKDQNWLSEQLDVIKFMCKDFWISLFKKQVDKLQTNYKGIYVLHDLQFRLLTHIFPLTSTSSTNNPAPASGSSSASPPSSSFSDPVLLEQARIYTAFSVGMIRGALMNLGVTATVKAEIIRLPACQFTITDLEKVKKQGETTTTTTTTTAANNTTINTSSQSTQQNQPNQ